MFDKLIADKIKDFLKKKFDEFRTELDLDADGENDFEEAKKLIDQIGDGLHGLIKSIDFDKLSVLIGSVNTALSCIDKDKAAADLVQVKGAGEELLKLVFLLTKKLKA